MKRFITTCVVAGAILAMSQPTLAANSYDFMFIGDSITAGNDSVQGGGPGNGYRGYLYDNLYNVGDTPSFAGSQGAGLPTVTPQGNTFNPMHNGYPGKRVQGGRLVSILGEDTSGTNHVSLMGDDPFATLSPDIIFVMGGTNDINTTVNFSTTILPYQYAASYIHLLEYIFDNNTTNDVHLVVTSIPHFSEQRPNYEEENDLVDDFNAILANIVAGNPVQTGGGVNSTTTLAVPSNFSLSFLDLSSVMDPTNDLLYYDDGSATPSYIHPSNLGYSVIADAMFAHLQTQGYAMPEPASLALLGLGGLCLISRRRSA